MSKDLLEKIRLAEKEVEKSENKLFKISQKLEGTIVRIEKGGSQFWADVERVASGGRILIKNRNSGKTRWLMLSDIAFLDS